MENISRRKAVKAALAGGSALMVAALPLAAQAHSKQKRSLAGGWTYQGMPCAIFQEGQFLLVVNEVGSLATAKFAGQNTFVTLAGFGWDAGLVGTLSEDENTINWANSTSWVRG